MKTHKFKFLIIQTITLIFFFACDDEITPDNTICNSGINVQLIDDSQVPASARIMVYEMPAGYIGVGMPNYSSAKKVLVIPYEFATEFPRNTNVTVDLIRSNLFGVGTISVREYFLENSYGAFEIIEGAISTWVKLAHDRAFYGTGMVGSDWTRNSTLHQELCQKAPVNWTLFDTDNNHIITPKELQICFMASIGDLGANRPSGFTINTNFGVYTINNSFVFFDCKRNGEPDSEIHPILYNFSTICHEFCHGILGLPDRYADYCGSGFTGKYDIMSDNCSWKMMNMFDRMKLGWIYPKILEKPVHRPDSQRHCYMFTASATSPAAVVLYDRNRNDQYWIVENRYKPASAYDFDSDLPESGLAIWWVNATNNEVHLVNANDPTDHPQTYSYNSGNAQQGVLFKHNPSETGVYTTYLSSSSGNLSFLLRAVSPAGNTMYVEF